MQPNEQEIREAILNANPAQFPNLSEINQNLQAQARIVRQHSWHQQGPEIVCTSCNHHHSQWLGPLKKLTGLDDNGNPKVEDIKFGVPS